MNNAQKEYLRRAIQAQLNQRKEDKIEADKKAEVKRLKAEKDAEKNKIETRAKEFRRYEYLMGIDDISRAVDKLLKGDSTAYNKMRGIDQFRVDEAMSLIDKYSKKPSTPSTTTSGGTTGGGTTTGGTTPIVKADPVTRINQNIKNTSSIAIRKWTNTLPLNEAEEIERKARNGEPIKRDGKQVIWTGKDPNLDSSWEIVE